MITVCEKEIEEGNIEYKRFFENITINKLYHLISQMNWRINEGNGVCHYYLGVCDNGTVCKDFTQERIDYTLDVLKQMVDGCNSYIATININRVDEYIWFDVVIKRKEEHMDEYRVLLVNSDISKLLEEQQSKDEKTFYNNIYISYIVKIFNNAKYLFFTYNEKYKHLFDHIMFNYCIYGKEYETTEYGPSICDTELIADNFMNTIENNMRGNIVYDDNKVKFYCLKIKYKRNIGSIIYGFLERGKLSIGMKLKCGDFIYTIESIHNNMVDCNNINGPATVSIKINDNVNSCLLLTNVDI